MTMTAFFAKIEIAFNALAGITIWGFLPGVAILVIGYILYKMFATTPSPVVKLTPSPQHTRTKQESYKTVQKNALLSDTPSIQDDHKLATDSQGTIEVQRLCTQYFPISSHSAAPHPYLNDDFCTDVAKHALQFEKDEGIPSVVYTLLRVTSLMQTIATDQIQQEVSNLRSSLHEIQQQLNQLLEQKNQSCTEMQQTPQVRRSNDPNTERGQRGLFFGVDGESIEDDSESCMDAQRAFHNININNTI